MTGRPVYRYPPRYRNRPSPGAGWGIIVPFFLVSIALIWPFAVWHGCKYGGGSGLGACGASSEWVWNGQTWTACGIWWGLIVLPSGLALANSAAKRRPVRPPKGRLRVEATPQPSFSSLPPEPQPPACQHLNAVTVLNLTEDEILAWLCPHCDTGLPEDFGKLRRPCCGTPHGLWHLDNCPHYRE